jgi:hypothetical protein
MPDTKVVVASVPFTDTTAPIMAPALFKGILSNAGIDCVGIDLNGVVVDLIKDTPDYEDYLRFFYYETVADGFEFKLKTMFESMTSSILSHRPTLVCLSLLHYQCQVSAKWLCFFIKKINPEIKIVIGGAGAFGSGLVTNEESFTSTLLSQGLIDYFISGDGDVALVELIKGNHDYPGINSMNWIPIENLNSIAYPDYDDYDFEAYPSPFIGILGSRGCVRQCTFCDIHEYWEKFKWRTGENIFQELLHQNQKYGIRYFKFQDSLINGNVKEYNNLILLLADHNKANPNNKMHWASYFILRPETQMSEEQWRLTAESGAVQLNIGIETFVEKNRYHLKKKFSNDDIEYGLAMSKKYNIDLTFLILVGYPTETEDDHQETLKWFQTHQHYSGNPIKSVSIGGTVAILPGTWLYRNQNELGIKWKQGLPTITGGMNHLWHIESTENTYETRLRRLDDIARVGTQCGFKINHSVIDPQKELENEISKKMIGNESHVKN